MSEIVIARIPIVGLPEHVCGVPTTDDGRTLDHEGEPIPLERRPYRCKQFGRWVMGRQPLCDRHFRDACHLAEIDPDEVEADWKEMFA